jgi:hypothetical protein
MTIFNKLFIVTAILLLTIKTTETYSQTTDNQSYFQQKVLYHIEVQLDDKTKFLYGSERIVYINNSEEDLKFIWFHLWPNGYKNDKTALCNQLVRNGNTSLYYAPDSIRGYIDSLDFKIDGQTINLEYHPDHIDICKLNLPEPLAPHDSVVITTPFRVKIPSAEFSRLGYLDEAFMITQWYPKPAVYDKKGWHPIPYLNQGEFYSEFGNFDVIINLPEKYVVGATGKMVYNSSDTNYTAGSRYYCVISDSLFDNSKRKTLRFRIDSVHDFAWFANKDFRKKSKTITLESGHKVKLTALFLFKNAKAWKYALRNMEQGVKFYSRHVGEYPYDVCTAVDGALAAGGGMEYPTITVIGQGSAIESTLVHEIGHNWFYGILGFNERDYPWMDEGINTFYQSLYEEKYYGDKSLPEIYTGKENKQLRKLGINYLAQYFYPYVFMARHNLDQPLSLSSDEYTSANYGAIVYMKSAMIFRYLRDYLGPEDFDTIMQNFYNEWKFKHPQPEDFTGFFRRHSKKNIDWFLDDILLTNKKTDYAITKVKDNGDSLLITVKNKGDVASPFSISGISKNDVALETLWYEGSKKKQRVSFPKGMYKKVKIDAEEQMPDINRQNNSGKTKGLFKSTAPLKLKLLYSVPFKDENPLYFLPAAGWNKYSGFMLGAAIYNDPAFERKWEFQLIPLYAFKSKQINGEAGLYRNFHTNGFIRKWSIGITGRKYDYNVMNTEIETNPNPTDRLYFYKYTPELRFYFRSPSNIASVSHILAIRNINLTKQTVAYSLCGNSTTTANIEDQKLSLLSVEYNYTNKRKINPFGYGATVHYSGDIFKAWLTANYSLSFKKNKSLDIRVFAGNIFSYNSTTLTDYSFKLSSWSGSDDYLFDYTYPGRSEYTGSGIWSAQMTPADGGFSIPTPLGRSWSWLAAVNLKGSLPFTNLVRLYADFGLYPDALNNDKPKLLYEGGAYLNIIPGFFEIYFPFLWSKEISDVAELNNKPFYEQKIRFTLRLNTVNPFKLLREIEL